MTRKMLAILLTFVFMMGLVVPLPLAAQTPPPRPGQGVPGHRTEDVPKKAEQPDDAPAEPAPPPPPRRGQRPRPAPEDTPKNTVQPDESPEVSGPKPPPRRDQSPRLAPEDITPKDRQRKKE